ncbi:GGDEF domain-containing protein [Dermatobacter hominis]|uniref:GGDEF domain-containing protein n=1 Tax=Dermatobacter hominis TaxID=2884263 RepID=UPI001D12B345|nr:sensor domain-containing diguanylate cyclase [Dermatobacter hominis]UDY37861.1 sensor domain-containing diguanylate cyclase [Dermatobacter hominis]
MIPAPLPDDESQRLAALAALGILDTDPEESFDRVTRLAQRLFDVPVALVSLIDRDREWYKSNQGMAGTGSADRSAAFCAHAILSSGPTIVEDARLDPRFHDHPAVLDDPDVRFYAGVPLRSPTGHPMGTLCVIDRTPRTVPAEDLAMLVELAAIVEHEFAIRHESATDRLTGLYNRRALDLAGPGLVDLADQLGHPLTVLFVDLDGMKPINDGHGHAAGDVAIVECATALRRVLRQADVVARVGGDEFVAVLSGVGVADAGKVVTRLQRAATEFNAGSDHAWDLCMSVGVATREPAAGGGTGATFEEVLRRADADMYEHKRSFRSVLG